MNADTSASPNSSWRTPKGKILQNDKLQAEEANMRVFLTGATGYIGGTVAEHLRAAGLRFPGWLGVTPPRPA
jgi:hypothetical protein